MKNLLLSFVFIISGLIISCSENDETGKQELQLTFADSIAGVWVVGQVTLDGEAREEWKDLQVEILKKNDSTLQTYSTGIPQYDHLLPDTISQETLNLWTSIWLHETVWVLSENLFEVHRSDGITMTLTASSEQMTLSFNIPGWPQISCDPGEPCILPFLGGWEFQLNAVEQL